MSRELDAEVAEKVMGWTIVPEGNRWRVSRTGDFANSWCIDSPNLASLADDVEDRLYGRYAMPRYSADISAAMEVVDRFRKQSWMVSINASSDGETWWVCMYPPEGNFIESEARPTPAEAICRAALATLTKEQK